MIKFTARDDRVVRTGRTSPTVKVTDTVTDMVTDMVTDGEQRILQLLVADPGMSYVALANEIGISKKTVAQKMSSLKAKGIIERVGTNKKGYWKINKYPR